MRALLAALILSAAGSAAAVEPTPLPTPRELRTAGSLPEVAAFPTPLAGILARVLTALAVISGAGAGLVWWSRKRRGIAGSTTSRIQIIASRAIGPRHQVVLIEIGDRRLLLGTAPESVRALADLSEVEPFAAQLARELPETEHTTRRELMSEIGSFAGLDV